MPLIEVTAEQDRALEGVAPSYLKGPKATTRRVQWAISEIVLIGSKSTNKDSGAAKTTEAA